MCAVKKYQTARSNRWGQEFKNNGNLRRSQISNNGRRTRRRRSLIYLRAVGVVKITDSAVTPPPLSQQKLK